MEDLGEKKEAEWLPKMPSFQISLTYSCLGRGIFDVSMTIWNGGIFNSRKSKLQIQREDMRNFFFPREERKDGFRRRYMRELRWA